MPMAVNIEDLPLLEGEAALFDAAIDPTSMKLLDDHVIISIVTG